MHKHLLLLFLNFLSFFLARSQSFDLTTDGTTVVVHEAYRDTLFVYNLPQNKRSEIAIAAGANNWVQLIADTLVMVQYIYSDEKTAVYSLATGNKVFASSEHCFTNESKTALYWIDRDWTLHKRSLPAFAAIGTALKLQGEKDSHPSGYFKFSADGARIAVAYHQYERGYIGVFDLRNGKKVNRFKGFECCGLSNSGNPGLEMRLFDISKDGTLLIAGSESRANLYHVNKGSTMATLQTPSGEPAEFGSAAFSADGKTVYVQSQQKIYIQNTKGFTATDTLSVEGKMVPYGTPVKYSFEEDFSWKSIALTKDNRYLFVLCQPAANGAASAKPFIMQIETGHAGAAAPRKFFYN